MLTLEELIPLIVQWADDRKILKGSTIEAQTLKTWEEWGETCKAIGKGDIDGIRDGIGDVAVTLIIRDAMGSGLILKHGIPDKGEAWEGDIFTTVGAMNNGFIMTSISSLSGRAAEHNLTLTECLNAAWLEIKDRRGEMRNGIFTKEADL